jgi:osmoprotectant transport system substrate-binding protein
MNRRDLLAAAAALCVSGCAAKSGGVSVGSKNFSEALVIGNMYALALQHAGLAVTPKLDLGGTQVAMAALRRGDIDLYPEYTGTALINVLGAPPSGDRAATYARVKSYYERHFDLIWLDAAPMNNTQALASTRATAQKYQLKTLGDVSRAAPMLRLGAIPEFTKREDGLPGLQRAYGGFVFKSISLFDIGLKYRALEAGDVDVVVAFGTDGQIEADRLTVFEDDKHVWPVYAVAPVVRAQTLGRYPVIAPVLNRIAPLLTDDTMRRLNEQVDGEKREPADVARDFLTSRSLLS